MSPASRFALAASSAVFLAGCPLTDDYYVEPDPVPAQSVTVARCGDGVINGDEGCDGAALGEQSCEKLGLGQGVLSCQSDCRYDVTGCAGPEPICGDGVAQALEACDLSDLRSQTCELLGLPAGTLSCTGSCTFDTSGCKPPPVVCGDGTAQGVEGCDGADLRAQTCETLGLSTGTLTCTGLCTFDLSGCQASAPTCGDGTAENTESCDDVDLRGETCETLGLAAGTLHCASDCELDTSECGAGPSCDGYTGPEVCDGVTNDCDDEVDEGGVCPENGTAKSFGGHVYLLYQHLSDGSSWGGGSSGGYQGGGGRGGDSDRTEQQDYGEATTTCLAAGAALGLGVEFDLARIESVEENDFLKAWIVEVASEAGMFWMGANDVGQEGRWVWGQAPDALQFLAGSQGGGGTPVEGRFNDFADGRPNSSNYDNEDCGAFDSEFAWRWNDLDCTQPRLGLICEQLD